MPCLVAHCLFWLLVVVSQLFSCWLVLCWTAGELSRSPDFGKSCPEISKLIMESASDLLRKNIPLSSSILSSPSSSSTCGSSSPPSSSASPREFTKQPTTLALLIQGHDIDDSVEIELTSEEGTPEELICHSPSFLEFMSYLETDSNSDDDGHTTRATSPPVGSVSSISGSPSSSACSAGQIVPCNRLSPSSCSPSSLRVAEAISTLNHHRKSAEVLPNSADKERPLIAAKRRKSDVSSSPSITEQESHDMDGLVLISPVQSDDASDTSSVSGDGSPRVANEDKCMNLRRSSSSWVSARKKSGALLSPLSNLHCAAFLLLVSLLSPPPTFLINRNSFAKTIHWRRRCGARLGLCRSSARYARTKHRCTIERPHS